MEPTKVSKRLLTRLPVYLNYIKALPEETTHISATKIAGDLGFGDVLVRKDLAKISNGGRRKTGHSRETLIRDIENYLDYSTDTGMIIVGTGKLGQALLDYRGFEEFGMRLLAGFDARPPVDRTPGGKIIYPMDQLEDFCSCHIIRIGIIAVPAAHAQNVCDRLVDCGIEAIWNFAPTRLNVPAHVTVQNEDLAISLNALRMQMKANEPED